MFTGFHFATYNGVAGNVGGCWHNENLSYPGFPIGATATTVRNTWLLAVDRLKVYRAQGWSTSCCTKGTVATTAEAPVRWTINDGTQWQFGESSDWQ
jgi:hypothetical protein